MRACAHVAITGAALPEDAGRGSVPERLAHDAGQGDLLSPLLPSHLTLSLLSLSLSLSLILQGYFKPLKFLKGGH